ncbi:MAG: hypothetical protein HRF50_12330 [Phycisphaerae bacterium]|jgi:uncharacterized Zn-binding protein involved in type VI secretion
MPPAARVNDLTSHGPPMNPGPGSPDIEIGFMPAWRALPAGVGAAVEAASNDMNSFMTEPVLTPASATPKLVKISAGLIQAAAQAAAAGNVSAVSTAAQSVVTLNITNISLTATWTAASPVPGGQPAANTAYTEGIKAAAAAAAISTFSAIAGTADMHNCPIPVPIPPHGPGFVTKASTTVEFNGLPACRQDDKIFEACGGADPIALGCLTVEIGDETGSGDGGNLNWENQTCEPEPLPEALVCEDAPPEAQAAEASFAAAAYYGTPLVSRCEPCDGV